MGNCHPEKTNVDRGEAKVDIGFRGGDNYPEKTNVDRAKPRLTLVVDG